MLKIKDEKGKVIGTLTDEDSEPNMISEPEKVIEEGIETPKEEEEEEE